MFTLTFRFSVRFETLRSRPPRSAGRVLGRVRVEVLLATRDELLPMELDGLVREDPRDEEEKESLDEVKELRPELERDIPPRLLLPRLILPRLAPPRAAASSTDTLVSRRTNAPTEATRPRPFEI
jgi:hypothetical protein